jgi:hypothetical protein
MRRKKILRNFSNTLLRHVQAAIFLDNKDFISSRKKLYFITNCRELQKIVSYKIP